MRLTGRWCSRGLKPGLLAGVVLALGACGGASEQGADVAAAHPGEQTYMRYCYSCHAAGIASAPRVGSSEQWAPRIAKGEAALLQSTIAGIPPGMPARGLCRECTDEQLAEAIDYMISRSR